MAGIGFGPTLGLRQRGAPTGFEFAGVLPAGASLARGTAGTRIDAAGRVASEAAGVARFDHDPLTLALRGLLIEPVATNVALASEAFDAGVWINSGSTIVADVAPAPSGAGGADKMVETAMVSQHRQTQGVTVTAGQPYTFSLHVKAAERSRLILRLIGTTTFAQAQVNLAGRTLTGVTGAAVLAEQAGGWFRVAVTGTADAASVVAHVNLIDDAGASSYAGTAAAGLLLWGAQVEAGSAATSYIATTTGATAARGADALTLDWGAKGWPDGPASVRYTFDDGTSQDVATTIAGGTAAVPAALARARLRRAAIA